MMTQNASSTSKPNIILINCDDLGYGDLSCYGATKLQLKSGAPPAQLYDLEKDPQQAVNVYENHPEVVQELDRIVTAHRNQIGPYSQLGFIALKQS